MKLSKLSPLTFPKSKREKVISLRSTTKIALGDNK